MGTGLLTPFRYVGSKIQLAPIIANYLPPDHKTYCEVFGGSGAVLFHKRPSEREVWNDINGELVNLYRVLQDPYTARELKRRLRLTLYSRSEFDYAKYLTKCGFDTNRVNRAYRTFLLYNMAFGGVIRESLSGGFSTKRNQAATFRARINALPAITERLSDVIIENLDWRAVLKVYDTPQTTFYLDPPYPQASRLHRGRAYHQEMQTQEAHHVLLEALGDLQGDAIISSFDNPLYNAALSDWHKIELTRKVVLNSNRPIVEVLYLSPSIAFTPRLF